MLFLRSVLAVNFIGSCITSNVEPVVEIKQGKLRGSIQHLLDGAPYYSFKGVPYAQPPVGELRFQAPRPPQYWNGIRDAINHGPICPQFDPNTNQIINGSEDCLFINIYTRYLQGSKLPVMVYIHGGGFSTGSGNNDTYGPEFILQHNVVLVTMNYRLEVLGFLSLDTPEVPGNAGMKDQVFALRWIKENIAKFGGDSENITIFGESAGSVAVTHHLISPMSKGLFHKAIAQSGVGIDDSGIAIDGKDRAFRLAKALGKESNDIQVVLQFLRSVPAMQLTNVTYITQTEDEKFRGIPMGFGPVIEKIFSGKKYFIANDPITVLIKNEVNVVPLIIGYNSAEGLIMLADQLTKKHIYNSNSTYLVPRELVQKVSYDKAAELGRKILKFYTGDKGIQNITAQGVVDMKTDMHFAYNIHRFSYFYSKKAPVYFYRFEYSTNLNIVRNFLGYKNMTGACHADDLFYFFFNNLNKEIYLSEKKLQDAVVDLTKLWTNFAESSDPTKDSKVDWKKYSASQKDFLSLNEVMTPGQRADALRMNMWNTMYCEAGLPYIH